MGRHWRLAGSDVLVDDMGLTGQGVAQGGIVDTPQGEWYGVLFQDTGAVGRIPVLVPVTWKDDYPVFGEEGKVPKRFPVPSCLSDHTYEPLVQSDDFRGEERGDEAQQRRHNGCFGLKSAWQFNHEPDLSLLAVDREKGILWMTADKVCHNLTEAKNTLTQRMQLPGCAGEVTVNFAGLKEGDYAGLCALQGCYGMAAAVRREGRIYVVMKGVQPEKDADGRDGIVEKEWEAIQIQGNEVRLKAEAKFGPGVDQVQFYYLAPDGAWKEIGIPHRLYFRLDHFTGCRFGLFLYAAREKGGKAGFRDFIYETKRTVVS